MSKPHRNRSASCLIPGGFDEAVVTQAARACLEKLGTDPDLVFAFVTSDYGPHLKSLIEILRIDGHANRIAGGSACGLVGVGREQERISGLSLLFLRMPSTTVTTTSRLRSGPTPTAGIILSNSLKADPGGILKTWQGRFPGIPLVGGCVTGGPEAEDLFLFSEAGPLRESQLLIQLNGGIRMEPLVAPGCRPIGKPLVVTAAKGLEVLSLGRREPFTVLEETFSALGDELQLEAEGNIFAGLAIREELDEFKSGDFQIHQIVSATLHDGRLTLGAPVRAGQTMQFQLRDSLAAERLLLKESQRIFKESGKPFASLLFNAKGRGKSLFGAEDRNIRQLEEVFGQFPLTGIYTHGEIAPHLDRLLRHDHSVCGALLYSEDGAS